jgi:hypothetical protein
MSVKPRTWAIVVGGGLVVSIIVAAGIYAWRSSCHSPHPVPAWPPYVSGEGVGYCANLGDLARERSMLHTVIAAFLAVLGSCAVIVGNLLEPGPPDAGRRWVRNRGALLLNFGGLLLVMSYYEFSRADAASLTAASAAMAQADAARERAPTIPPTPPDAPDREAYVSCAVARATWLKSRVESSALAQSLTSIYHSGKGRPSPTDPTN